MLASSLPGPGDGGPGIG